MTTWAKADRCYRIYQRCAFLNQATARFWLARYRLYQDQAQAERAAERASL